MDAGTDTPPRSTFLAWAQAFNQMRNYVTTWAQGLLGSADAAAARTTLDVPTRTGGNASGTWGIGISGNAATATTATNCSRSVAGAGLASGGGALSADQTITVTKASQAQAEAGTDDATAMTPLRTAQAIAVQAVSIGVNQTWQAVTRVGSTDYQNTTGRAISVMCTFNGRGGRSYVGVNTSTYVQVGGNTSSISDDANSRPVHSFAVPPGHYYKVVGTINNFKELR
jgi:hypothetical protein